MARSSQLRWASSSIGRENFQVRLTSVRLLENNSTARDRHRDMCREQIARGNPSDINWKHDNVGKHAGCDNSLPLFFEFRIGGAHRIRAETIVHR
jgi:hypothetical protein